MTPAGVMAPENLKELYQPSELTTVWHGGNICENSGGTLQEVIFMHQREWDEGPPLFLLAYRELTHKTRGTMPASTVFGRPAIWGFPW
jgi:hypothetical protein